MLRHLAHATLLTGFVVLATASYACGSDDSRCASLCEVQDKTEGDVCSQASADACIEACNDQIGGVETVCANCLLEDAEFLPPVEGGGDNDECKSDTTCLSGFGCVAARNGQTCKYCEGDIPAKSACDKQLNPLREVQCTAKFNDTANCTAQCGS